MSFETVPFPSPTETKPAGPVTLASLAAVAASASERPTLVRFIHAGPADPKSPEGKAVAASRRLQDLFEVTNDDVCIASKFFRMVSIDVSTVSAEASPVHELNAPAVVVLDAAGKAVQTLGPGQVKESDLLAAMARALHPKVVLSQVIAEERNVIRDVLKLDTQKAGLDAKKRQQSTAKPAQLAKLEADVQRLEEEIAKAEAEINDRESRLFSKG